MAKTPEDKAKDIVKRVIADVCGRRGLRYEIDWHAGSAFENTLDGTGVVAGHPFICEIKRFDENCDLTGRQKMKRKAFQEAGAKVFDIVDLTAVESLRHWLETLEPRLPHDP